MSASTPWLAVMTTRMALAFTAVNVWKLLQGAVDDIRTQELCDAPTD